jgi:PAP2 superfamily
MGSGLEFWLNVVQSNSGPDPEFRNVSETISNTKDISRAALAEILARMSKFVERGETTMRHHALRTALATLVLLAATAAEALADPVIDWNVRANEIVVESKIGTPPAMRVMAIVQTAVHDAVQNTVDGASIDAAVAAANRATLSKLLPAQQASIDRAYQAVIGALPKSRATAAGIEAGEHAAAAVLAARANDTGAATEPYRPHTSAGKYVPTAAPAVPHWATRKPWLMATPSQFRPAPPPALESSTWARDYNEVKLFGAKNSAWRNAEQTEIANFWEYSLPPIYHGVMRSVAAMPGRDATQNARLFAAATQALDDSLIAVFDAKYQYNFWRPITAVRNGDMDGNAATERDAAWTPLHDAPMHPEYPSGHAILAGALGAVLEAELGAARKLVLSTSSPSAKNITRRWNSVDAFVQEVGNARVYEGIHFRSAVDAGTAMGRQIGTLAAQKHFAP